MSVIKGTNTIVAGYGGTKRSIGEVYFSQSSLATDNNGALPLFTGETITSANTIYPDFYNWVLAHTELQCTSSEYESALSTYGECPKYVIGKTGDNSTAPDYGNTTVAEGSIRLPLLKNFIKMAELPSGVIPVAAGLPDHDHITHAKGTFSTYYFSNDNTAYSGGGGSSFGTSTSPDSDVRTGDASESNSVYGKSDTVTPAHTTLYPWVSAYTAAIPASEAQVAEFQQAISALNAEKADTSLSNVNLTSEFKHKMYLASLPDTTNGYVTIATDTSYTVPADGWVWTQGYFNGGAGQTITASLNGVSLPNIGYNNSNTYNFDSPQWFQVSKGDVWVCNRESRFYGLRG